MAKVTITGMEQYTQNLGKLVQDIGHINNMALYDAAAVAKDAIVAALQGMPTHEEGEYGTEANKLYGATSSEKAQIIANFGVSPFRYGDGSTNTSLGFTGYVSTPSRRFNDHIPTGMLMQSIEYGTSFRRPTHTISTAIKNIKARSEQAAQERINQEIQKIGL